MVKRRNNHKWVFRAVFLILLIIAGVICYLVWDNYFRDKKIDDNKESQEQVIEDKETTGEKQEEEQQESGQEDDGKKTKQYEGDDPNLKEELSGSVTYAGKLDNRITIRVNIDQYLGDGECKLNLMSGDAVAYSETTKIVSAASTATCEGFDIPSSSVGAGNYTILIDLSSGGKKGTIRGEIKL